MEIQKHNVTFVHTAFVTVLSLLLTFLASRIIYLLMVHGYIPPFHASFPFRDTAYHIHHFVFGIFGLSLLTFFAFAVKSAAGKYILAALYGVALGVIYDETQMWLFLTPINSEFVSSIAIVGIAVLFIAAGISAHLLGKKKNQ